MDEASEVEGAIEKDAVVGTEDEEESNDDSEMEEERQDKEVERRKRNQEKSKQHPLYYSSRLPMVKRRMELCHTSSHITSDSPSSLRAEPRQHIPEEPAPSNLGSPSGSSSRNLTCSWRSSDHSTCEQQIAGSYTVMEDLAIINYIVREDAYDRVRGRALWQEMATNFSTGRTWQSLKERFRKRIVTNLHLYTAHGLAKKTIQKLEGKTVIDTGHGKMQNQRHQRGEERLQNPAPQSGSSCRPARRTKGLGSSESKDKITFDPQQRRSRIKSSNCSEKKKNSYKHSRKTKRLSSSESEDERTFDVQQRRSRVESSNCSKINITSYKPNKRTKRLSSSESEDERAFDLQQRRTKRLSSPENENERTIDTRQRSRMESISHREKNITNYKYSRRIKRLASFESEGKRTFDPQQRSRIESSSCSENTTIYKHGKRTKKAGSSESDGERAFDPQQKKSRIENRSCSEKYINSYKHSKRTTGLSSSENEGKRILNLQKRESRIMNRKCREKYLTNKKNSYSKVKRHKSVSQKTESEDSDSEESLSAGNGQSHSVVHPHYSKGKHLQVDHAKIERSEATERRKEATSASSNQRGQNITSKSEEYKDWKLKVLQEALGKAPHCHSKFQMSDAGSSFYFPPSSRHAMHNPLHKKWRLSDCKEMCMLPPKTPVSHSSKDLPRNLLDQQRKHQRDGSTVNTKTQGQHKLQTLAERSDACDDSDTQDSVHKDSEASGTTSRHIPLLESDMNESDQGTLPDLNFSTTSTLHQSKIYSTEEKEDTSHEDDDESTGGSIALFEL